MSKTFVAKYPGRCYGCCTEIQPGQSVRFKGRGALYHSNCVPSGTGGRVSRDDRDYYQGRQDYETLRDVRAIFGEAAAIEEELRQDARAGDY